MVEQVESVGGNEKSGSAASAVESKEGYGYQQQSYYELCPYVDSQSCLHSYLASSDSASVPADSGEHGLPLTAGNGAEWNTTCYPRGGSVAEWLAS